MTNKRGTVKLFTFSFEIDAPNIINSIKRLSETRDIRKIINYVNNKQKRAKNIIEPCGTPHKIFRR